MEKILSPIKARILEYLIFKGFEKKYFFESAGIAVSNFRSNGLKSEVGGEVIAKILALYPEINAEWLLTGKGEMLKGISVVHKADNEPVVYRELVESMKKTIALQDEKIARLEKELAELKYSLSNNPIVYSNVAEPPPELMKKELPNDSSLMQK